MISPLYDGSAQNSHSCCPKEKYWKAIAFGVRDKYEKQCNPSDGYWSFWRSKPITICPKHKKIATAFRLHWNVWTNDRSNNKANALKLPRTEESFWFVYCNSRWKYFSFWKINYDHNLRVTVCGSWRIAFPLSFDFNHNCNYQTFFFTNWCTRELL
jgi:hypothetical protein